MSYDIIYNKQFVRTNKGFIPMILVGCSNVFDVPSGARARSWSNVPMKQTRLRVSEQEMLDYAKSVRQSCIDRNKETLNEYPDWDVYDDKHFGYFSSLAINVANTRKTTYKQYENIFVVGIEKAQTVETLRANGITFEVHTSRYDDPKLAGTGFEPVSFYPKTSDELDAFLDALPQDYPLRLWGRYSMGKDTVKRMHKRLGLTPEKKEKPLITVNEGFAIVLKNDRTNGAYFHGRTRGSGYRYSFSSARYWYTEKAVKAALKAVKDNIGDAEIETVKFPFPKQVRA